MLKRIYDNLDKLLKPHKALIIYGPRRAGKTTLLNNFLNQTKLKFRLDSGDNIRVQNILSSNDFSKILNYASEYDLIAIDGAQRIPNIGMGLKIIIDQCPKIFVIATGSSSFDLSQQIGGPLTGRKNTLILYPLSQKELYFYRNKHELKEELENFLIFGSYPEVIEAKTQKAKQNILNEIVESYLLKDILVLDKIKSSKILLDLLKLLAFQVGSQVSLNELANKLKIDIKTVDRYLDLLEKSFVIKRISGFSRNLRKEVVSKAKYYFFDNGVRNAVISQFNKTENRNDVGALFENFIITERIKKCFYEDKFNVFYFWRTYDGQEIDLIEERKGKLFGFEIKWNFSKKILCPKDWKTYKNAEFKIINQDNYLNFIL
ncbi:ATP-binding protein [Candidatus Kuenenbacteria bacterium]|nr:ATP-binding protein [Candidatus Kuenenbacteria bacterium]